MTVTRDEIVVAVKTLDKIAEKMTSVYDDNNLNLHYRIFGLISIVA